MPAVKITPSMRAERLIRMSLAAQGLNQKMLAKRLGENYTTVHGWVKDIYKTSGYNIAKMCKTLKIDASEIFSYLSERT